MQTTRIAYEMLSESYLFHDILIHKQHTVQLRFITISSIFVNRYQDHITMARNIQKEMALFTKN